MNLRLATGVILMMATAGCISIRKIPQTNIDPVSGWSEQTTNIGVASYRYAQMSNNAYRADDAGSPPFDLGNDVTVLESQDNDELGFAYKVFELRRPGMRSQVVIAYRGTENDTPRDWYDGTLRNKQAPRALAVFDKWRATRSDADFVVTGHSLGGALAISVSLKREHVAAYVFNTSPRFSRGPDPIANERYSIVEYGEVLKITRIFAREANQLYASINCSSRMNAIKQHSIRRLANCLTQIAAWKQPGAKASLIANNIEFPPGMPR